MLTLCRLFLQKLPPDFAATFPSGIKAALETYGFVSHYLALKETNKDWDVDEGEYAVEDSALPVVYLCSPAKKRKTGS